MNETEFTTELHACLDARRDPLDDAALCAWLAEHPEHLEAFAALRQRLASLPATVPAARAVQRPRAGLRLAGAAGIAAAVLAVAWPRPEPAPPVRGILAASLVERRPRAGAAVSYTVRQAWSIAPDVVLETHETRSQSR